MKTIKDNALVLVTMRNGRTFTALWDAKHGIAWQRGHAWLSPDGTGDRDHAEANARTWDTFADITPIEPGQPGEEKTTVAKAQASLAGMALIDCVEQAAVGATPDASDNRAGLLAEVQTAIGALRAERHELGLIEIRLMAFCAKLSGKPYGGDEVPDVNP